MTLRVPLHDPDFYRADPYPAYQRLRREAPVYWHEECGWWALAKYEDVRFVSIHPELFTSTQGIMIPDEGAVTPNKLELMIAAGNPKNIAGAKDLGRDDLVQSHPNPLTEGIFKFYGSQMLKDLGLHEKVTGGAECKSCWAVDGKTWFTSRHHRETPHRIEQGEADVGIVWTTEVVHAKAEGRAIDGVDIPAPLNKQDKVNYAIGVMKNGRNQENAARYLAYLATDEAQAIYESYGFLRASSDELAVKSL